MGAGKQVEKEIREAYLFLRERNNTIPSETLEFMKDASLEKLRYPEYQIKTYWFDCWDRNGKSDSKSVVALTSEQAKIIFEHRYPDLGYDEPYY